MRSPNGDEAVPEGQDSAVEIIAVDPQGTRVAARALRWELLRETWQYDWYSVNGVWRHRTQISVDFLPERGPDWLLDHQKRITGSVIGKCRALTTSAMVKITL